MPPAPLLHAPACLRHNRREAAIPPAREHVKRFLWSRPGTLVTQRTGQIGNSWTGIIGGQGGSCDALEQDRLDV